MKYLVALLFLFTTLFANNTELKKVSLQLLYLDQFQFAGYYMAKEKGFYREIGVDVELKKYKHGLDIKADVFNGISTYGVGSASLVKYDSAGSKITFLAAIFQSLPNILLTLKSSNINAISDFKGKTLMREMIFFKGH